MANEIGFFLNLDQGSTTNERVVAVLSEIGYRCIEYDVGHLNPQTMSTAEMQDLARLTKDGGLKISEYVIQRDFVHFDAGVRAAELNTSPGRHGGLPLRSLPTPHTNRGHTVPDKIETNAHSICPILCVSDFDRAVDYFVNKLDFKLAWDWGTPPHFGCVRLDEVEIFLSLNNQGQPGSWIWITIENLDAYCERIRELGADIVSDPKDKPWGNREFTVRLPDEHTIRFGSESSDHTHDA